MKQSSKKDGKNTSEERLNLCLSAGNRAWGEMDVTRGKVVCNENKVTMLGFSMKDFVNADYHSFMNLVHPKDYDRVMSAMKRHLEGKTKHYEVEYRIQTREGGFKWFHDRGAIVQRDQDNKPLVVKGVVFDITKQKKAEEKLRHAYDDLEKIVQQRTKDVDQANKQLQKEIIEKKKANEYTLRTKEYLKNIIDSASEIIVAFDMNHRVSMWNKSAEKLTGYKSIEVLNRSVGKLEVFYEPQDISSFITTVCTQKKFPSKDIYLKTKNHEKKILRISGAEIQGSHRECLGALFLGRDITQEMELHGKLLEGCSYLIPEATNAAVIDLFVGLIRSGHHGLFITRGSPAIVKSTIPELDTLSIVFLRKVALEGFTTVADLLSLTQYVTDYVTHHKNAIILFDGIHYLLTRYSFTNVLETLYELTDTIATTTSVLFIRIDPQTITTHQNAIIQNELPTLPSHRIEDLIISDSLSELLDFINEQNQHNRVVSVKKIKQRFNIAYVTAAHRLKELEDNSLIFTKKQGKLRTIFITDKGRILLHKRDLL
jgi:PAS domain S-box-containing protein